MTDTTDSVIDRLVQAAIDVLHHDTTEGSVVDKYERRLLIEKFDEILAAAPQPPSPRLDRATLETCMATIEPLAEQSHKARCDFDGGAGEVGYETAVRHCYDAIRNLLD